METDLVVIRYVSAYRRGLTHVVERMEESYPDRADRFDTIKKTLENYVSYLENTVRDLQNQLKAALTMLELQSQSGLSSTERSRLHKARRKLRDTNDQG